MDNAQGGAPAADADAGGDWRSLIRPEGRGRIVNRIMETLKKHPPVLVPEGVIELQKIAVRFEEKIYTAATSKSDYLRKISLKMLTMESQNKTLFSSPGPLSPIAVISSSSPHLAGQSQHRYSSASRSEARNRTSTASNVQSPGRQSMDNAQDGAPAANAATGAGADEAGGDWRSLISPEARGRIVNRIMETLKKHLPLSVPEGLIELQKIAVRFEEKIYAAATSQTDYLRKISVKMLTMESQNKTNTQENPQNGQVVQNQRPCFLETSGSTSHRGHPVVGDLKEELCQMNKILKEQYVSGLGDLYEISMKLHGDKDNHMPTQEPKTVHEEVNFKSILERSLHSLQINKKRPSPEESIPLYKREIVSIINSEEWKKPKQTFQQSADEQAPSTSSPGVEVAHEAIMVPPERGNIKRLRRYGR